MNGKPGTAGKSAERESWQVVPRVAGQLGSAHLLLRGAALPLCGGRCSKGGPAGRGGPRTGVTDSGEREAVGPGVLHLAQNLGSTCAGSTGCGEQRPWGARAMGSRGSGEQGPWGEGVTGSTGGREHRLMTSGPRAGSRVNSQRISRYPAIFFRKSPTKWQLSPNHLRAG